jgi:hypothetical protein
MLNNFNLSWYANLFLKLTFRNHKITFRHCKKEDFIKISNMVEKLKRDNPGTLCICTRMDENYREALAHRHIREWFFATEAVQDQSKSTLRRSPARKIGLLHKPHYFVRFERERDGLVRFISSTFNWLFSLSHTRARAATFGVESCRHRHSVDAKLEGKWKQAGKQFSLWYKEGGSIALIVCGSAQRDAWGARGMCTRVAKWASCIPSIIHCSQSAAHLSFWCAVRELRLFRALHRARGRFPRQKKENFCSWVKRLKSSAFAST